MKEIDNGTSCDPLTLILSREGERRLTWEDSGFGISEDEWTPSPSPLPSRERESDDTDQGKFPFIPPGSSPGQAL
jgi:hypothetical protein